MATLLALALLAAACSGDEGEVAEPTTTLAPTITTAPTSTTTTTPPADVGISDMLGTQAVQDFAIHLGMWVLDDNNEVVDFYDPLLDEVMQLAGTERELAGGFTFAPVQGLDARMVDADGEELPSLSVDFALLGATRDATDRLERMLVVEGGNSLDPFGGAARSGDLLRPLLVELVTADYAQARTHAAPGDRSEIDVTFIEEVAPGDELGLLYFFGQTLPGDPRAEQGLSPAELFASRWDSGLVRVLGEDDGPAAALDSAVDALTGSTVLSREQKREIAALAGNASLAQTRQQLLLQTMGIAMEGFARDEPPGRIVRVPVPGAEEEVVGLVGQDNEGKAFWAIVEGDSFRPVAGYEEFLQEMLVKTVLATCTAVAAKLAAYNEAHRRPDRLTAVFGFLPDDAAGGEEDERPDDESDDGEPNGEPEEPPLGCDEPPDSGPFAPGPTGGMAYGDVRMTTIDGTFYSNNAAGEFVLYDDEAATVQMRLEPWAGGVIGVSVATAAGIAVDGHTLSLHLDGSAWVDGEPADFERGDIRSLGSAEVTWWGDGWVVVAPDGTLIRVDENLFSLVIRVDPSDRAAPTGLLGDADGDSDNDLVLRDGTPFDGDTVRDVDRLYGEYIESWRISDDESLFHYGPGESTDGFTIDGFPGDPAVIDDLSQEDRASGEEACAAAGVFMTGDLLDACILDVALTGEPAFAIDSFDAQILAVERMLTKTEAEGVTAVTPGDTLLTIDGETLVFGVNPPNQRPQGIQASWACEIIDGDLFADGRIDLADGPRYTISVQYLAAEPRFALTVQRSGDEQNVDHAWVLTNVAHFAEAVDDVTLEGTRLTASGEIYVNDPPQVGLTPFSELPVGAMLDPFTLDLDCAS